MIGLDTNVLVRFLVRDDEEQFEHAQRLIRREAQAGTPVLVSHLVLLESGFCAAAASSARLRSSARFPIS